MKVSKAISMLKELEEWFESPIEIKINLEALYDIRIELEEYLKHGPGRKGQRND